MNKLFCGIGLVLLLSGTRLLAAQTNQTRVVLVHDPRAVRGLDVDSDRAQAMVSAAMKALTGQAETAAAWRSLFSSNDVVGVKVSTQGAPLHATHPAVVMAIVAGLASAGVPATNIVVWDRDPVKLRAAGYATAATAAGPARCRIAAVIGETGWDARHFYESSVAGRLIWGDRQFGQADSEISTRSHLPRLVTETITKLINVPVLQDHDTCGLAGCLYNLSLAMVDNTRRFEGGGQRGSGEIAEICAKPEVRQKLVLNIMDALIGGYAGGPGFKPEYSWANAALYVSRDPVAIDALCLKVLEAKRLAARVPAIGNRTGYLAAATQLGLGESDPARMELIEIPPAATVP